MCGAVRCGELNHASHSPTDRVRYNANEHREIMDIIIPEGVNWGSPPRPRGRSLRGQGGLPKFAPEGWLFTKSSRWAWCYNNILSLNQILIDMCHISYLKSFKFFMWSICISNMFCYAFAIVKVCMAQLVECSPANFWAMVQISVESNTSLGTIIYRDD